MNGNTLDDADFRAVKAAALRQILHHFGVQRREESLKTDPEVRKVLGTLHVNFVHSTPRIWSSSASCADKVPSLRPYVEQILLVWCMRWKYLPQETKADPTAKLARLRQPPDDWCFLWAGHHWRVLFLSQCNQFPSCILFGDSTTGCQGCFTPLSDYMVNMGWIAAFHSTRLWQGVHDWLTLQPAWNNMVLKLICFSRRLGKTEKSSGLVPLQGIQDMILATWILTWRWRVPTPWNAWVCRVSAGQVHG